MVWEIAYINNGVQYLLIRERYGHILFKIYDGNGNYIPIEKLCKEAVEEIMKDSTIPKDVKAKAMMVLMEEECDL